MRAVVSGRDDVRPQVLDDRPGEVFCGAHVDFDTIGSTI
jgi:hypothetical protein